MTIFPGVFEFYFCNNNKNNNNKSFVCFCGKKLLMDIHHKLISLGIKIEKMANRMKAGFIIKVNAVKKGTSKFKMIIFCCCGNNDHFPDNTK